VWSYRPISNISVLAKLSERLVARQLKAHLNSCGLLPRLQFVYRANQSIETAVLNVLSDILLGIEDRNLSALALLDHSAAFDTVDHDILLWRLDITYRLIGTVLNWFKSCLVGRRQQVRIGSTLSIFYISHILQGATGLSSLLGAVPAVCCCTTATHWEPCLRPHLYAGNRHIYEFCAPNDMQSLQICLLACINHWLTARERIDYNLAVLMYKCLRGTGLAYLADELSHSSNFESRRRLRSVSSLNLIVCQTRLSHMVIVHFLSLVLISGTVSYHTSTVLGMTLNWIHIFIVTGSFLYWCVIMPANQRFFIHSCIYLRILIISYLATFLGSNSLSVLMCRKAVNQSIILTSNLRRQLILF